MEAESNWKSGEKDGTELKERRVTRELIEYVSLSGSGEDGKCSGGRLGGSSKGDG